MKSIRRSLILYFLVLLAGALGAVSVLAYHTAQQTLQAKEEIRQKLLETQYRERCREQIAKLDSFQDIGIELRTFIIDRYMVESLA